MVVRHRRERNADQQGPIAEDVLRKLGEPFEREGHDIQGISKLPWKPEDTRKARIALDVARLPPVRSTMNGPWSDVVAQALTSFIVV